MLEKIVSKFTIDVEGGKCVDYRKAIDLIYAVKRSGAKMRLNKLNLGKIESEETMNEQSVFDKDPYQTQNKS